MVTYVTADTRLLEVTVTEQKKRQVRLRLGLIGCLLANAFSNAAGVVAAADAPRVVIVLYPDDNDGRPGNVLFDRGVRSVLSAKTSPPVEIHSEYLDLSRTTTADYPARLAEFLRVKFADRTIEAVIAGLAPTLDFALQYRRQAFTDAPVVIGAIDERELSSRSLPADVIGVPISMDLQGTLQLALQLHPQTEQVFVVSGASPFDVHWDAEARRAFSTIAERIKLKHLTGLPLGKLQQELEQLPPRSLVYYLHVFQDPDGTLQIPAEVLQRISPSCRAPMYGHVDSYIGRGIVGGRAFSWDAAGQNAAQTVLRLLDGESPEAIGIAPASDNRHVFDWQQLQRWGVQESALPPESLVLNRTPSFWDSYKWQIIGVVSLCVLQGLTIAALLTQRVQRAQAEGRFRQTVEAAPIGMLMIDRTGLLVLANAEVERLFGYSRLELLGQAIELLLPVRFQPIHVLHRSEFLKSPEARPMGAGRELFGQRRDGTEFPVEVGLSPLRLGGHSYVLASVIDISQRRNAERGLRESQLELRELTGRLLISQEAERRRIARELHDDFSQSLALLSVQVDILRGQPADSPQFAGILDDLSTGVKQLSSSLHELSHQLHPFKLEQMGLVPAIRGVCLEVAHNHSLKIDFQTDEPLPAVSLDRAVCLYRIVQEALRNVVRHSQATVVQIKLACDRTAGLTLEIADNGCGFQVSAVDGAGGLGLLSMRERLHYLAGTLQILSQPGAGTTVVASLPRDSELASAEELQTTP